MKHFTNILVTTSYILIILVGDERKLALPLRATPPWKMVYSTLKLKD
jgi:hypothetical protein